MQSNIPLPYAVEYAKSGRSLCKKCRKNIGENCLRMSICQQASFFDGNIDSWFHFECFWQKLVRGQDQINISSIRGVDWLKWEDQEKLRHRIQRFKENRDFTPVRDDFNILVLSQLKIEKSATARGKCAKCGTFFEKNEIKFWQKRWLHAKCLFESVDKVIDILESIPRWNEQEPSYQAKVRAEFEEVKAEKEKEEEEEEPVAVKSTVEDVEVIPIVDTEFSGKQDTQEDVKVVEGVEENTNTKKRRLDRESKLAELRKKRMKKQVDKLWEYRQCFDKNYSLSDKHAILHYNDQDIPEGHDPTAQLLDRLVDNSLFGCPIGCPVCPNGKVVYDSARRTYVCTGYATEYSRCQYESKNPTRTPFKLPEKFYRQHKDESVVFNELSERLYNEDEEEEEVIRLKSQKRTSSQGNPFIYAAEAFDGNNRVPAKLAEVTTANKHIIKNGTVVDAKFPYASTCHVCKDDVDGTLYQATLSFTDLTQNKNSFYKIQLLKEDHRDVFFVFRSWGRVGTDVGDTKTERHDKKSQAVDSFLKIFMEKTKNDWKYRKHFRKMPGMFHYVETDFSEFEDLENQDIIPGSKTKLPKSVAQLVMSMYSVENMKSALQSFEMDVNKMPLGKLSRNQINQAFEALTELSDLLTELPVPTGKVLDVSNKFYTIIPHNFGMKVPEPLDTFHKVKEKNNMLNALLEIKYAYDQICGDRPKTTLGRDPVDVNYEKMKCAMQPLNRNTDDYRHIEHYMKSARGSTHDVEVQLLDIHCLDRLGESSKFKSSIGNRMLLWHGSGKMNFAGILSQGLRIAPPEAPASGYMFGKGVYFADMFTKSFFYCRAGVKDEAYLLLCDVALGQTHNLMNAKAMSLKTLPKGTNSVKGMGRECPNADGNFVHPEGYMIPKGQRWEQFQGVVGRDFSLLYNEYIVYDVDQIRLKYLVRVRMLRARHL